MTWYRQSQAEDDNYETNSYLKDLVKNVSISVFGPWVEPIKTSACETLYDVAGVRIRLFVTVGNNIGLATPDGIHYDGFRINDERWLQKNWIDVALEHSFRGYYKHQDPNNPQGPTYDLLPEGKKTLLDFAIKVAMSEKP